MSESLEFDPSKGSAESYLEVARNRLLNAQAELEHAREEEKPATQIESLEKTVVQYQEDLDGLEEEVNSKSMGIAA